VQITYDTLPQFVATGALKNIAAYVNKYRSQYPPWVWRQVSQGRGVYAVPEDIGPMAWFYQPAILTHFGLTVPKTWAAFAKTAVTLHKKDPKAYLTYFPTDDGEWYTGLLWQAGATLFRHTATGWIVNINSPISRKVMNYWGRLIQEKAVALSDEYYPAWASALSHGQYASMIGAAWSPAYEITPYVSPGSKNWRAAQLPQWSAHQFFTANDGGSANAVTVQSKHPAIAAEFAAWINTSTQGLALDEKLPSAGGRGLFPADKHRSRTSVFNSPIPVLNGQDANAAVFGPAAAHVRTGFTFSPWQSYVYNQMTVQFTKAAHGQETWDKALAVIQQNVMQYARTQGYSVRPEAPQ
jgi:multiple sugar transport system substrate-binding protein